MDGANYIGVGPAFPSGTKPFEHFPGLGLLKEVAAEIRLPAFAIGGITIENVREVLATGIRRVAMSGAVLSAVDPAAAVREIRDAVSGETVIERSEDKRLTRYLITTPHLTLLPAAK